MRFNCSEFVKEFSGYVNGWGNRIHTALEVGCLSGELMESLSMIHCDGIDIHPRREDVTKADIREFEPEHKYDLVFSSGLLEHYSRAEAISVIQAMASCSDRFVLNYVPNADCVAYKNAKSRTYADWRDEADYTEKTIAKLVSDAGLVVLETGTAGAEWAKRFGKEPSAPYLVYCMAEVPKQQQKETEGSEIEDGFRD